MSCVADFDELSAEKFNGTLCLANTVSLIVPSTRCTTVSDCTYPVAAPRAWNDLPPTIRASLSLLTFRQQLKTFLFNPLHWFNMMGLNELNWLCKVPLQMLSVTEISAYWIIILIIIVITKVDRVTRSVNWSHAQFGASTSRPSSYWHCSELGRLALNTLIPVGLFTLDFVCMPFSSVRLLWTTLELPDYYAASLWLYLL